MANHKSTAVDTKRRFSVLEKLQNKSSANITFNDLMSSLNEDTAVDSSKLGEGFEAPLNGTRKRVLVGKPFVIFDVAYDQPSNNPIPRQLRELGATGYVTLSVITEDDRKYIVNDGSTGIAVQMWMMRQAGIDLDRAIVCKHGLRESRYTQTVKDEEGNPVIDPSTGNEVTREASTFYIDTSA